MVMREATQTLQKQKRPKDPGVFSGADGLITRCLAVESMRRRARGVCGFDNSVSGTTETGRLVFRRPPSSARGGGLC